MRIFILIMLVLSCLFTRAERTYEWDGETLNIVYSLDECQVLEDPENIGVELSVPGFTPIVNPGRPKVIHRGETFLIPEGMIVAECNYTPIVRDTIFKKCVPSDAIIPEMLGYDRQHIDNIEIEEYQGVWPINSIELGEPSFYRNIKIGRFHLYPAHYDYYNERIIFDTQFSVSIKFAHSDNTDHERSSEMRSVDNDILRSMISILPQEFITSDGTSTYGWNPNMITSCPLYLIVTPTSLETQARRFAEWKNKIGFSTKVLVVPDGYRETYLNALIKNEYNNSSNLEYVLLFGNANLLHSGTGKQNVYDRDANYNPIKISYYTDYHYFCMDGESDMVPDVYGGRLPVANEQEAKILVDKIMSYEQTIAYDEYYYVQNNLFTEFDLPLTKDGKVPVETQTDRSYFTETCYKIEQGLSRSEILGHQYIPRFLHYAPSYASPKYFKSGNEMPTHYQSSRFWKDDANVLAQDLSWGIYLLGIRGHGATGIWTNAYFTKEHVKTLTNKDMYPVIFAFTCLSGSFHGVGEEQSIGANILTHENGGAVACIAPTNLTWSPYNDYYFAGLYSHMYDCVPGFNIGNNNSFLPFSYNYSYTLGKVIEGGRIRLRECFEDINSNRAYYYAEQELYHLLGDPTLEVKHGKPLKVLPNFEKQGDTWILNDPRKLVVSNPETGQAYIYKGDPFNTLESLEAFCERNNVYLVGDVGFQSYIPEPITLQTLATIKSGGTLTSVLSNGDKLRIETHNCDSETEVINYDIYGNIIDRANISQNVTYLKSSKGINIVTLVSKSHGIIDTKSVGVK